MIVKGIVFAGTATSARSEMRDFLRGILGMVPAVGDGVEAYLSICRPGRRSPWRHRG